MARESQPAPRRCLELDDGALLRQCEVDCYRSHGPGGQKRNKTSSAVRLRHRPTGLSVTATEDRSQHVNRRRALRRLREAIALNVRTDLDPGRYTLSPLLTENLGQQGRLAVGRRDPRYYQVTVEILDVLVACRARVREAARLLNVSTAHLVGLIRRDVKLWKRVNELRAVAGVRPLR